MATAVIIIPIIIVTIVGLAGYLLYRLVIYDWSCKRTVNQSLQRYNIKETPSQIIKKYYDKKGESISPKEIQDLEKNYRQKEPEQFLAMYDAIMDNNQKNRKED